MRELLYGYEAMRTAYLHLAIDPSLLPTAQQKGACVQMSGKLPRIVWYTKAEVRRAGALLMENIRREWPRQSMREWLADTPAGAPWGFGGMAVYALPKSYKPDRAGTLKVTAPDTDNWLKLPQDVLTKSGLVWKDDRQVHLLPCLRRYALPDEAPHISLIFQVYDIHQPFKKEDF